MRFGPALLERARARAVEAGVTLTALVERAVQHFLNKR